MAETHEFDLVCIGSGPAGQRAAVQAAKLGKRAAVVEKRRRVGGVCIETGTIPSKTLREAVISWSAICNRFERRPAGGAEGRPTAEQLLRRVEDVTARETDVIEAQLARNDVRVFRGRASFASPHSIVVASDDGWRTITTDKVLIAVGTSPAMPPGVAPDGECVMTSDDVIRMRDIPRTMVVIGAGVIGMEYASMFAAVGVTVTVVERRDRALEFLDREIVDELMHQLRSRNVTFRLGETVASIEISTSGPRRAILLLESGKRIVADVALFSAGRVPATGPLELDVAGLATDARGRLAVDAHYRTEVPHIYAAGDVIGYPSLAATSAEQGRLAACHAFGVEAGTMAPHFPVGIYSIPEISMVGATEQELTERKVPYETGVARYREIARGQILGDDSGLLKMLFDRRDRRLLGIHGIGTGATELIHIGQAVIALGGSLDYFLTTVFNYPTLAECYKVAALDASNKLRY